MRVQMLKEKKLKTEKTMLDFVVGPVTSVINGNTFKMQVTHIGKHNKYGYRDFETIKIADRVASSPIAGIGLQQKQQLFNQIFNRRVRCHVRYRDAYNILICDVEVI